MHNGMSPYLAIFPSVGPPQKNEAGEAPQRAGVECVERKWMTALLKGRRHGESVPGGEHNEARVSTRTPILRIPPS